MAKHFWMLPTWLVEFEKEAEYKMSKLHPIRAALAIGAWGATIYFLASSIVIPDAWWAIVATVSTFYFVTAED